MSGQEYITLSLRQLPRASCSLCGLGESGGHRTDKSTAVVTPLFSPWAAICRDRSLLRVREEFVVPEPSLGSSAGTTDDGAHCCGRVCISPAPRQPNRALQLVSRSTAACLPGRVRVFTRSCSLKCR